MQVILTEDVANVGEMGEVVKVSPGYGRNYLIPQGLALPATHGYAKRVQHERDRIEKRKVREREEAMKIVGDIDGLSVTIPMRVGEGNKLFGSVGTRDIAGALDSQGVKVSRKQVQLARAISELGIYQIPIKLASGVYASVRVWVVAM